MEVKQGYKQSEVGLIPQDWEVVNLGDEIEQIIGGGTPSRANTGFWNGNINWATVKDLTSFEPNSTQETITESGLLSSASHLIKRKTLIISTRMALGKAVIYNVDVAINQDLKAIFPKPNLDNLFLYYWFEFNSSNIENLGNGSTVKGITLEDLQIIPFIKIPLTEQIAIATALSDADALISSLEQLIAKKRNIKQGAMQELLKPKEGWKSTLLGEIALFYKGKGLGKNEIVPDGRYKCIHYGELFIKYKELILCVLSRTGSKENKLLSRRNDVLMPTSDVTPTGLATASCLMESDVILGGDILVIRIPENTINGTFLSYSVTNDKSQILNLVKGVTVYHLYGSDMKKFRLNYPNIQEQNDIINILTDMETEIESLEIKLEKYKMIKQGMMQTLLTGQIRLI